MTTGHLLYNANSSSFTLFLTFARDEEEQSMFRVLPHQHREAKYKEPKVNQKKHKEKNK